MAKVFIYPSHKLLCHGLALTAASFGHSIVGESQADVAVRELCSASRPYPPPSSLPTLAILANEEKGAFEVLLLGYHGYLSAASTREDLKGALAALLRGERWAPRQMMAKVLAYKFSNSSKPHHSLTRREHEVYELLITGLANRDIGRRLKITEKTVKGHASSIYQKLNVGNRRELMANRALLTPKS